MINAKKSIIKKWHLTKMKIRFNILSMMKYNIDPYESPNYEYDVHNTDVESSLLQAEIDNTITKAHTNEILFNIGMKALYEDGILHD